jgi:hypothetical protein
MTKFQKNLISAGTSIAVLVGGVCVLALVDGQEALGVAMIVGSGLIAAVPRVNERGGA